MTHYVYEFIAADGSHLYIGCTGNIGLRLSHHLVKDWWGDVSRVEVDSYPDKESALDAERERIKLYQPTHNVTFTDHDRIGGWATRRARIEQNHAAGQPCHERGCALCSERARLTVFAS